MFLFPRYRCSENPCICCSGSLDARIFDIRVFTKLRQNWSKGSCANHVATKGERDSSKTTTLNNNSCLVKVATFGGGGQNSKKMATWFMYGPERVLLPSLLTFVVSSMEATSYILFKKRNLEFGHTILTFKGKLSKSIQEILFLGIFHALKFLRMGTLISVGTQFLPSDSCERKFLRHQLSCCCLTNRPCEEKLAYSTELSQVLIFLL